tara:strand:- start:2646 stop:3137 length:492 start_codon:yes stop_codon:yes gene_type:complete
MSIIEQLSINLWIGTVMNIKTLSLFLMTLVYFDVFAAEQITVYRWIDKDKVVHFSQHQPEHDDYIEISMAKNQKSSINNDTEKSTTANQAINNTLVNIDANNDAIENLNNDKCVSARENIDTLQNFDKIQFKDEKGNVKVLSALDKKQQLSMNTKQAEVYCTD